MPVKVVLTLKPIPGLTTKKKKARVCVCGNFQQKNIRIYSIPPTPMLAAFELSWLKQHSIWTMA